MGSCTAIITRDDMSAALFSLIVAPVAEPDTQFFFGDDDSSNEMMEDRLSSPTSPNSDNPKSPKSRKNVRFADDAGKPLVEVVFIETNESSVVLSSSVDDSPFMAMAISRIFNLASLPPPPVTMKPSTPTSTPDSLELLFPDPLSSYSALSEKLRSQNVALESVCCRNGCIKGMIRVRNVSGGNKSAFVRMTFDAWRTHYDWTGDVFPVITSCDNRTDYDLFEFSVPIPPYLLPGSVVEFAICYRCGDSEFWDNNYGKNYSLRYHRLLNGNSNGGSPRQPNTNNNSNTVMTTTTTSRFQVRQVLAPPTEVQRDEERAQRIRDIVSPDFISSFTENPLAGRYVISSSPSVLDSSNPTMDDFGMNKTSPGSLRIPYW